MRLWWGAVALFACLGCATNRYGTARALPDGESTGVLSLDAVAIREGIVSGGTSESEDFDDDSSGWAVVPVPLPVYTWRKGLGDDLELGLGFGPFLGTVADLKIELVRSTEFDLAIAPTAGFSFPLPLMVGGLYLAPPLLAAINVSRPISLIAQLSPQAIVTTAGATAWLSGTVGAQLRLADEFALQPAVALHGVPTRDALFLTAGLALAFGAQPDFGPPPPPPDATEFWDPPEGQ